MSVAITTVYCVNKANVYEALSFLGIDISSLITLYHFIQPSIAMNDFIHNVQKENVIHITQDKVTNLGEVIIKLDTSKFEILSLVDFKNKYECFIKE